MEKRKKFLQAGGMGGEDLGACLDRVFGVLDDVGPEAKDSM
jgi:hypothetical protein